MRKNTGRRAYVLTIFGVILGICLVSYVYIRQLNKTVSNNMLLNMEELSLHDMESIQSYLKSSWQELENVSKRFGLHKCKTVAEVQGTLNAASESSAFRHLYLLDEEGNLYTDDYRVYPAKSGHGFDQYFENGQERMATTYRDPGGLTGIQQEMLLYGLQVDYKSGDTCFAKLFGLTDISILYEQIKLDSFGGRGYGSITDRAGNYIVNSGHAASAYGRDNIYEQLASGKLEDDTSISEVTQQMENNETFSLTYTDMEDVEWVVMFRPVSDTQWYFFITVPSRVFRIRAGRLF